jgi:hypothetical protein
MRPSLARSAADSPVMSVCRQNISDGWRVDLRECLAHLV